MLKNPTEQKYVTKTFPFLLPMLILISQQVNFYNNLYTICMYIALQIRMNVKIRIRMCI